MLTFCLLLLGVGQGYGFFNTPMMPPYIFRNHANSGYEDAQNSVGYAYDKPANAWSDVSNHQLILEPVPKSQYFQDLRQQQYNQQPIQQQQQQPQPQQQQDYSNQQQLQQQQQQQPQQQQQDYSNQQQQPQQIVNHPSQDAVYEEQPYSYLQPPQKNPLAFNDERYEWSLQPAIKYNMPHIPHPFYQRDPQQQHMSVLVPMKLFGVQNFPPVLERLIQMVQNHYSVYNNPDTLIIPPIPGSNKPYFYEKPTIPFEPAMMGGAEQGTGVPMMGGEQEMMGGEQEMMAENNQTMGETEQEAGDKTETTTTVPEEGLIDERFGNSGSSSASTEKSSESSTSMMEKTTEEMPAATTMKAEDEKMVDGEGAATTASTTEGKEKEETTVSEETSTSSSSSSETMTESEQMESTTTTETAESTTEKATLEPMN